MKVYIVESVFWDAYSDTLISVIIFLSTKNEGVWQNCPSKAVPHRRKETAFAEKTKKGKGIHSNSSTVASKKVTVLFFSTKCYFILHKTTIFMGKTSDSEGRNGRKRIFLVHRRKED